MTVEHAGSLLGFPYIFVSGGSARTILLLHGTGGDERDLLELGRQLAPGTALLSPRGRVLEGTMPRFFARHPDGELDIEDLLVRTDELAEFARVAAAEHDRDSTQLIALGLSNGANIAASLLLRRGGLLRGAVLLRARLPYEPAQQPALTGTDVLIAAGDHDPYSSTEQIERLAAILRGGGANVTVHRERDAGHELTREDLRQTARWLAEH